MAETGALTTPLDGFFLSLYGISLIDKEIDRLMPELEAMREVFRNLTRDQQEQGWVKVLKVQQLHRDRADAVDAIWANATWLELPQAVSDALYEHKQAMDDWRDWLTSSWLQVLSMIRRKDLKGLERVAPVERHRVKRDRVETSWTALEKAVRIAYPERGR